MATSIQRLIVMMILINILVVIVIGLVCNLGADDQITTELANYIKVSENWSEDTKTAFENSNPDTSTIQLDKQYGNIISGQKGIWDVMKSGLIVAYDPLGCIDEECSTNYILFISYGIKLFLAIVNMLVIMEVVWIIYSKKYT